MTYSFIDTTAHGSANSLPAEALAIEGNYIENIIDNLNLDAEYRTLTVSGRELLAPELKTAEVGMRDGVFYNGKHMPSREIKIKYRLIALTSQAFREAYNKLSGILLSIEQSQLVFADEPDKFFLGTFSGTDDVEEGRNAVNGEFTITCTDPCKYSIEEYMPELQNGVFTIDYDGTYVAHPIFEVTFQGDCGRVSFANDKGKALQFGDDELTDTFKDLKIGGERIALLLPRKAKKKEYLNNQMFPEYITEVMGDEIEGGRITIAYVDEVKGVEFDKVFVVKNGMTKNEAYIACTRALSELTIVNDPRYDVKTAKAGNNSAAKGSVKKTIESKNVKCGKVTHRKKVSNG